MGRKPGSPNHVPGRGAMPKKWSVKLGDKFAVWTETPDGSTGSQLAEVVHIDRHKMILRTQDHDIILIK